MRSGDFSAFLGPVIGTDALGRDVRQGQIYDPFSERTVGGQVVRDPIPNNVFPPALRARMDAAALKIVELFPAPIESSLTQNFRRATSTGNDADRYDVRIDHALTTNHKIFGRQYYL